MIIKQELLNQPYKWVVLLGSIVLGGCQSLPAAHSGPEKIFRRGRKLVYQVARQAPNSSQLVLDTLSVTCLGKFKSSQYGDTTQRRLGWSYTATSAPNSFSGVLENDSVLWSHPPRDGDYGILELSPYPYIKLPATAGNQWQWPLTVGSQWSNKR